MRLTAETAALIDAIDVTSDAAALGLTPAEVRRAIREAVGADLLAVEAGEDAGVILRAVLPAPEPTEPPC